jgi:release factor glutamine methyltransferase
VELIQKDNPENQCSILDIGTGSGCIAVTLKHLLPRGTVAAFDISENALKTAQKNANKNGVKIIFSTVDILKNPEFAEKWDIIVSNPPYIPHSEKAEILPNVLHHEPHLALFVPDENALVFYEKIAQFALKHLKQNGKLYFEIHSKAGQSCVNLLNEMGFKSVELRKDIAGNDRMIKASVST